MHPRNTRPLHGTTSHICKVVSRTASLIPGQRAKASRRSMPQKTPHGGSRQRADTCNPELKGSLWPLSPLRALSATPYLSSSSRLFTRWAACHSGSQVAQPPGRATITVFGGNLHRLCSPASSLGGSPEFAQTMPIGRRQTNKNNAEKGDLKLSPKAALPP